VIDVETTGLSPDLDRVIEIAVVRTDRFGHVVDEWCTLLDPGGPVGAAHVHGITAADVRGAPRFVDVAGDLVARVAGQVVVAHNAPFDMAFLRAEFERAGWPLPQVPVLCTLEASRTYLPDLERRRLADCCWHIGTELRDAHSALADARAAAALLAHYLDPGVGNPPRDEHLRLPDDARAVPWPQVPYQPVRIVARAARPEIAAPAGALWALLDALPLSTVAEEGAPGIATAYLELLYQVLEDGILTEDEAQSLADVAGAYSLSHEQINATHRAFLLALAHRVVEDGKVTREERAELRAAVAALGFTDDLPNRILDEARATLDAHRGQDCRPLPMDWTHGAPLHIGHGVAFTGCDPVERAHLEARARAVGLRVTGSVSRQTAVLVTDGANPDTTKATAARRHGTRVVSPELFGRLLEYIQPADGIVDPDPLLVPRQAACDDPATIRAWARAGGHPVGVRGRIPAQVVTAYRTRHGAAAVAGR
jgi:DNA polymerase-3 subunit epsilon